jgi:hypothetical protein
MASDWPFADTVVFDPANWPEIKPAADAVLRALEACRQAYLTLRGSYNSLTREEREKLFPDGLPTP